MTLTERKLLEEFGTWKAEDNINEEVQLIEPFPEIKDKQPSATWIHLFLRLSSELMNPMEEPIIWVDASDFITQWEKSKLVDTLRAVPDILYAQSAKKVPL